MDKKKENLGVLELLSRSGLEDLFRKKKAEGSENPRIGSEQDALISTYSSNSADSAMGDVLTTRTNQEAAPSTAEEGRSKGSNKDDEGKQASPAVAHDISSPKIDQSMIVDTPKSPTRDKSQSIESSSPAADAAKLWDAAYSSLQASSSRLLHTYEMLVSTFLVEKGPEDHSDLKKNTTRRQRMDRVVHIWLTNQDSNEATISNRETRTIEVDRSLRDILKRSLERSGYVSVPWAAACLAIDGIFRLNSISEANCSGIIRIISKMEWYIGLSRLLLNYDDENIGQATTSYYHHLEDKIVGLYTAILRFTIEQSLASIGRRMQWTSLGNENSTRQNVFELEDALIKDLGGAAIQSRLGQLLDHVRVERYNSETSNEMAEVEKQLSKLKTKLQPIETTVSETETAKDSLLRHMYDWAIETEEYKSFFQRQRARNEIGCGVLWVSGPAGAGKTLLMRATVQGLLEEAEATTKTDKFNLAYFFCDSREQTRACVTQAIKSLIWQMLKSQPSLAKHMEKKFQTTDRANFNDQNDFYAMSTVLYDLLRDIDNDDSGKSRLTYVIIDAIEELSVDSDPAGALHADLGVRDLLGLIMNTTEMSQHIKWVVSIDPSKVSAELTPIDGITKLRLDMDDTRYLEKLKGIIATKYIPSEVSGLAKLSHFKEPFQNQVTAKLARVAPLNFLWVNMACHRIKLHRLPWNATCIICQLPKNVDGLYHEAYEKINNLDYLEDQKVCRDILSMTAIAYRTLSKSEVESLLVLPTNVDLDIMVGEMCSSFLEIYNGSVRYVHRSARDFIRQRLLDDKSFSSKHLEMTNHCFRHAIKNGKSQSNRYATINWIRHLWATHYDEAHSDVFRVANKFFDDHLLEWTDTLTRESLLPEAAVLLRRLNTSLKKTITLSPDIGQRYSWVKNVEQALSLLNFYQSIESLENLNPKYSLPFFPNKSMLKRELLPKALPWLDIAPDIEASAAVSRVVRILRGHRDWVRGCCYSPDGKHIASGGDDGVILLWDAETFKIQHKFSPGRYVYQVMFTSDHRLVAISGTTIQVWNALTGTHLGSLESIGGYRAVHASPDGKKLVATGELGVVIFDIPSNPNGNEWSKSTPLNVRHPIPNIKSVRFSPDGALIAYTQGEAIFLRDVRNDRDRRLPDGHLGKIVGIDFSHNSKYLASCSQDGTVRIWDIFKDSSDALCVLDTREHGVHCVSFSPKSLRLASGSMDSTVIIWKNKSSGSDPTPQYEIEKILRGHNSIISSLSFDLDEQQLVSSSYDMTVIAWDISTLLDEDANHNEPESPSEEDESIVSFMTFSPKGGFLASAYSSGKISLWDCNSGHLLFSLTEHYSDITWLDFSHDGNTLVSASNDSTARVWNTSSQAMEYCFQGHTDWVRCAVISPDGTLVASVSDDRSVRVWNIKRDKGNKTSHRVFAGDMAHRDYICAAAFSPEGDILVSGGEDSKIMIWNLKLDEENQYVPEFTLDNSSEFGIRSLAFTKDGERIVSCEFGGTIRIWDFKTKTCEQVLDPGTANLLFNVIRFDERSTDILLTEIGAWPFTLARPPSTASSSKAGTTVSPAKSRLDRKTPPRWFPYGISNDRRWITWMNKNLLYLPMLYRPSEHEWVSCNVQDSMIAIGAKSGKVLFFKFAANVSPIDED